MNKINQIINIKRSMNLKLKNFKIIKIKLKNFIKIKKHIY